MPEEDRSELAKRLEALEKSLLAPEKREVAQRAAESGALRAKALGLPDRPDVAALASKVAALANRSDVVVEWRVTDVESAISERAVACACCCCCCCVIVQ